MGNNLVPHASGYQKKVTFPIKQCNFHKNKSRQEQKKKELLMATRVLSV